MRTFGYTVLALIDLALAVGFCWLWWNILFAGYISAKKGKKDGKTWKQA